MNKSKIEKRQVGADADSSTKDDITSVSQTIAKPNVSGSFPITKECHCGHIADKYFKREFVNRMSFKVTRIFYRCRNCWSRIYEDFIPDLDAKKHVNALDLLSNCR